MISNFNRTENDVINSYLSLIEEKQNIKNIKVNDVAQNAYIGRATFYRYFSSVNEIGERIETACLDELKELDLLFDERSPVEINEDVNYDIFRVYCYDALVILERYKRYFKLNYEYMDGVFLVRLQKWYRKSFKNRLVDRYGFMASALAIPFISNYAIGGIVQIITLWMVGGCDKDINEMVDEIQLSTKHLLLTYKIR